MEGVAAGRRRCFYAPNRAIYCGSLPGVAEGVERRVLPLAVQDREAMAAQAAETLMPPGVPDRMVRQGRRSMAKALPLVEAAAMEEVVQKPAEGETLF